MSQNIPSDFYVYGVNFSESNLTAGASLTKNINIQADANFIAQKLTYFADLAGAAQTDSGRVLPLVTLQITDLGSGRQLFNGQTPIVSIFGTGQIPFILPNPRRFKANSSIQITVTNTSAATAYNLWLSLVGQKEYI